MLCDTIAAVSTPRGKGGVALLRVSGPDAVGISARVFKPASGKNLSECKSRLAVYGQIVVSEEENEIAVDDGIATVFRAPASFTGEETVEICCHGGILLTETVLSALFAAGARPAEAGEFTRRAFLNGKMGLSSAEALGNMLEAKSREQILLAHSGMNGKTEGKCREIYDEIKRVLASVYVRIDYPDEDLADMSREEIVEALTKIQAKLQSLAETYRTGHAVAEGIRTVICGRPNVGKSSLYNQILGRDAAIVTDLEGTTRDILTETATLGSVTLLLCDTAGLRETADRVEKIGVERAKNELERAELILALFDSNRAPVEDDRALVQSLSCVEVPVVAILNKSDLPPNPEAETYYAKHFARLIHLSAKDGKGMDELKKQVAELFTDGKLNFREDAILTNARQHGAALRALQDVNHALKSLNSGYPIDVCCTDAECAMSAISELDGRAVSEDVISEIFSHFCVGK